MPALPSVVIVGSLTLRNVPFQSGKDEDVSAPENTSFFARRRGWSLYLFSPNNL